MSEQLEAEFKRDELILKNKLTAAEAEKEAQEWEQREWKYHFETFPKRCGVALAKYHACTLVMRFYEYMALFHSNLSFATVDKLTKDVHGSAQRKLKRNQGDKIQTGQQMFVTSLYANAIGVLSDISVQQCLLFWGYSLYYYRQRRSSKQPPPGGLLLSLCFKSCSMIVSRGMAWVASATGACIGTMVYPGWGTVVGTQLGDGLAGALFEKASGA